MKIFFKLARKVVNWFKSELDEEARLEQELLALELINKIPDAEKAVAGKELSGHLRLHGMLYHQASVAWIRENPGQEFGDFDMLPFAQKEHWMNQVQYG